MTVKQFWFFVPLALSVLALKKLAIGCICSACIYLEEAGQRNVDTHLIHISD